MRTFYLIIIFIFSGLEAYSQSTISGRILDKETKAPIGYSTIVVSNKNDRSGVSGTITDGNGRFIIAGLKSGEYLISCTFVGYKPAAIPILIGDLNKTLDAGNIQMEPEAIALDELVVTGKRSAVSSGLESKSYSLSDNVSQSGRSVLDAMKNMPGITVDQDGKVILRGSDKVTILVDGKQSSLTGIGNQKGLENIPALSIERIEIINNPSAKYEANGMAGIINIIYKKEKQTGFNGNAGFAYGIGVLTQREDDLPSDLGSYRYNSKYTPSLNMNYKTKSVNVFLQSSVIRLHGLPNNEFTIRHYDNGDSFASQVAENRTQTHYNVKAGLDWDVNSKNALTVFGIYDFEAHTDTSQVGYYDLKTMISRRNWSWNEYEKTGFANVTILHKYKFEQPGHELNTGFLFTKLWEDETYDLYENSDNRIGSDRTHVIAPEYTYLLHTDYSKPVRAGRFEAGVKGQLRYMPITYDVVRGNHSPIYEGLGDWSDWKENMFSGYLNLLVEKPLFDLEFGLRAEYTNVLYEISEENKYYSPTKDSYDYFNLFPNIRLTFKMDAHRISAFYNRRIDRPGEAELRIFPKYDDPELLKVGNPYLRPQYIRNFELAYKYLWHTGSVYLAGYHKMIDGYFTRTYITDEQNSQNIINKIYQNIGKSNNTGLEFVLEQKIASFWNASGSVNVYRNHINSYQGVAYFPYEREFTILKSTDNTWYAKVNQGFSLCKNMQIQLTGMYFAPKNIPQGRELSRWTIDAGIKKTVCNGRLEWMLNANDIFSTFGIRQKINGEGFDAEYKNSYETQVFTIGAKIKL